MGIILIWIILSLFVSIIGSYRKIGFWGAFFLALIFSPLIGLIFALVSKDVDDEAYKEKVLMVQQNQQDVLKKLSETEETKTLSVIDELERLQKLREDNLITDDEFKILKNKVINS